MMQSDIKFKKNMSTFSLMMTGITSIVGSGWLLATQKISNVAGPAGILAWGVGMIIAILIALFCIEIGTAHPSAGGIGSYSNVTHGRFSGFLTQWINWLSILAVPAVEAQAIVQYLSQASAYCKVWYNVNEHVLSNSGIMVAIAFMIFFMVVNYWGVKLFTRFNNIITIIKIIIPILTVICLFMTGFHSANFGSSIHEFVPYGFKAIGTAAISCGVIMSFNGFQLPLNFSEEIESPKRQLPIAIIGSIVFTFILYVLLQVVFIGKVEPSHLVNGWHGVNYRSPYVNLLIAANLQVMAWAVMSTSAIAPAACGSAFVASASRMIFNLARARLLPSFLSKLDAKTTSPRAAIITNIILGSSFLFMFKGWGKLVAVISVLHVFSYLSTPVVAIAYRNYIKQNPHLEDANQFKIPFATVIAASVIFILALLMFFSGWPIIIYLLVLIIPGLIFFFHYEKQQHGLSQMMILIRSGAWIIYFIIGISIICFLGNNKISGHNMINLNTSLILLALLSITSFIFGVKSAIKSDTLR